MRTMTIQKAKRGVAALVISFAGLVSAGPAHSAPASRLYEDIYAYVRSDRSMESHEATVYSFDGREFTSATILRLSRGQYLVEMNGLNVGSHKGVVQVVAYGTTKATAPTGHCRAGAWTGVDSRLRASVFCYDASGAPKDNRFALLFLSGGDRRAYVTSTHPERSSYSPDPAWSHNSSGGVNTITRQGAGTYTVTFNGMPAARGNVVVNAAYGPGNQHCKVAGWGGSPLQALVRCFDPAGRPSDSAFTAVYEDAPIDFPGAYLWANQPLASSYTPSDAYRANFLGGSATVRRTATGRYTVSLGQLINQGVSMVSAYGSGTERCSVESSREIWSGSTPSLEVRVACSTFAGQPVDTRFTLKHRAY